MISTRVDHISKRRKIKEFYSDFSINMDVDKNTKSLIRLINAEAVKESIKNLVLTDLGERFYHLDVGSIVRRSLFNQVDDITSHQLKETIEATIANYEPRAQNVVVVVKAMPQLNAYTVTVAFTIINIPTQVFHITEVLNRIR